MLLPYRAYHCRGGDHLHATRHTSHVTRHTSHVTRHASRISRHASRATLRSPHPQVLTLIAAAAAVVLAAPSLGARRRRRRRNRHSRAAAVFLQLRRVCSARCAMPFTCAAADSHAQRQLRAARDVALVLLHLMRRRCPTPHRRYRIPHHPPRTSALRDAAASPTTRHARHSVLAALERKPGAGLHARWRPNTATHAASHAAYLTSHVTRHTSHVTLLR
jgi:hypothetical protein